jgi:hypothetical protein
MLPTVALYLLITNCLGYASFFTWYSSHPFFAAIEFLRRAPEGKYDAVIVDSSDPVGESFQFKMVFPIYSVKNAYYLN